MVKRTGPTNVQLRKLIRYLIKASNKNKARIWKYVAELLSKPTRQRIEVNLKKLNKLTNDGDIVIVPGKVLGYGTLEKKITIATWRTSQSAIKKIERSGSKLIKIEELVEQNPKGSNVKIII